MVLVLVTARIIHHHVVQNNLRSKLITGREPEQINLVGDKEYFKLAPAYQTNDLHRTYSETTDYDDIQTTTPDTGISTRWNSANILYGTFIGFRPVKNIRFVTTICDN